MLDLTFASEQKKAFKSSSAVKVTKVEVAANWGAIPPSKYAPTYGALTKVTSNDPLQHVFGDGSSGHSSPLITRRSVELLPNVYSFDRDVLLFQRKLAEELNGALKVNLDDELFTRTGVHANFDRLRCPAGYFQAPMSFTAVDNAEYRRELGLNPGYDSRQKSIMSELWHLAAKHIVVSPVNVPKLSTGGMRRFSKDVQWKLAYAEWLFEPERFERMLDAVASDDWLTLANEFETVYATYIQKRGQVDDVGKVRTVFDLTYALSGGKKGKSFPTDKKVVIDGEHFEDFSAVRARVVHAGPWVVNCFLQIVSTCTMKGLFDKFPSTFHINTASEIKEQVDGRHVYCSDVTEYDRSMSKDAIELPHDVMKEYWDERIVKASWRLFTSPYYAKPLELDGRRGTWVKDPTDWSQTVFAGNRSGHAWTSLMAKLNKVGESLFIIDKIYPVLGRVERFLQGHMPMGLVNNGDDEIIWADTESDLDMFKSLRSDLKNGHYVVNPEVGNGFSGLLLVKPTSNLEYFPTARLQTPFEKLWVPERSIGGQHRKYWPIGVMTRIENIMSTDLGREAWSIHMSVYRRLLEARYGDFNDMLVTSVASMDLAIDSLSDIDKMVLDSPDKIHHQIDAGDVNPLVLGKITSKIPIEAVEKIVLKYFKGSLI